MRQMSIARPVRSAVLDALFVVLAAGLLGGCVPKSKSWTHPKEPNPRKEDLLFVEDTKFCEGKIGQQPQGEARESAMADCLRRLGWKPKE